MLNINDLAIDMAAAEGGKWITYPGFPLKFKIRRFHSEKVEQLQAALTLEVWDVLTGDDKEAADKAAEQVTIRVLSEAVLMDWEGISVDGKTPLAFSPQAAVDILSRPELRDIRRFVERSSINDSNWRLKAEEAVVEDVKPTAAS